MAMAKEYIERNAALDALYDNEYTTLCPLDEVSSVIGAIPAADVVEVKHNMTEFQKVWYHFFTGKNGKREHLELKLLCTKCNHVWDRQAYAFRFCPNCGRRVVEITDEGNGDNNDR